MAGIRCRSCGREVALPSGADKGVCLYCGSEVNPGTDKTGKAEPAARGLSRKRQEQKLLAAGITDEKLRHGIEARIGLLQRHLKCEKSLQKRQDVISALENALKLENKLLYRGGLLNGNIVEMVQGHSNRAMDHAGDLEKKERQCRRKKAIMVAVPIFTVVTAAVLSAVFITKPVENKKLPSPGFYSVENSCVTGVNHDKNDITQIIIPGGVTGIGNSAFAGCINIERVKIPDSVNTIGEGAFRDCAKLNEVIVPENCRIADNAFPAACLVVRLSVEIYDKAQQGDAGALAKLKTAREYAVAEQQGIEFSADGSTIIAVPKNITAVIIPHGVTVIGNDTFYGCGNLQQVVIPDSVTAIGNWAFAGCKSLQSITIPDGVTAIGNGAFSDCSGLQSVTLPGSVTAIGNGAFFGCVKLQEVIIPEQCRIGEDVFPKACVVVRLSIEIYDKARQGDAGALAKLKTAREYAVAEQHGIKFSADGRRIIAVPKNITALTIPHGVTEIGVGAFSGCTSLQSVTIPNSVREIGVRAFSGCSGLESVTIPYSVTAIGNWAFAGCKSLQSVRIPDSVTYIGRKAFSGCSGLESVTIPYSVKTIGERAFSGCSGLQSVTIPNSVTEIGAFAFSGCSGLESVTIFNGVIRIDDRAFSGCKSLRSVTIPNSVREIGAGTFNGCSGLSRVRVPKNCLVGDDAFPYGCRVVRYKTR